MSRAASKRRVSYVIRLPSYGITVYRGKSKSAAEQRLRQLKSTDKAFERCTVQIEVAKVERVLKLTHTTLINIDKKDVPPWIHNRWAPAKDEADKDYDE